MVVLLTSILLKQRNFCPFSLLKVYEGKNEVRINGRNIIIYNLGRLVFNFSYVLFFYIEHFSALEILQFGGFDL